MSIFSRSNAARLTRAIAVTSLSTLLAAAGCGDSDDDSATDAGTDAGSGVNLGVSSDWLNHTLTLVDLDALDDAETRADVELGQIDLSMYPAGPLNAEVVPGTKIALVSLSAGFFGLAGAGNFLLGASMVPTDPGKLLFVDLEEREVIGELDTGRNPMGIAITHDGKRAFVTHFSSPHVAVVDIDARALEGGTEGQVMVGPFSEEVVLDDSGEVGILSYSAAGNFRTFSSDDFAGTLSEPVELTGDAAGVAFFPGTKIAYLVQAPNPLTSAQGGYNVVDVTDPSAPEVLEDVRDPAAPIAYPAVSVPDRDSVVVPVARSSKLEVQEIVLEDGKAVVKQTIDAGPAKLFGAYSASVRADGKVLLAVPSSRAVVVVDLEDASATRVDWATAEVGPTDIIPVP